MTVSLASDRVADQRAKIDHALAQFDLAVRDTRDVEQFVEQPRHVAPLPLDDRLGAGQDAATSSDCRINSTALKIAASGLRSSWASIARNRSRCRTALRNCSYSRALSMASAPRPARSAANASSAGPNRRDRAGRHAGDRADQTATGDQRQRHRRVTTELPECRRVCPARRSDRTVSSSRKIVVQPGLAGANHVGQHARFARP